MLIELKFYLKDGTVEHDLIQCEKPTDWQGRSVLTNIEKHCKFWSNAFVNNPIMRIEKKCVLGCKTKTPYVRQSWCSGNDYQWSDKWYEIECPKLEENKHNGFKTQKTN